MNQCIQWSNHICSIAVVVLSVQILCQGIYIIVPDVFA